MCFDIRDLGNQLKELGMLIVQDAVWNRVSQNRERKIATDVYKRQQWEEMPTKTKFKTRSNAQGTEIKSHAYRALRLSLIHIWTKISSPLNGMPENTGSIML